MQQRRIGAHVSMAGGLVAAAQNVMDMGGNALQIFSGSPRSWARKPFDQSKADAFKSFCQEQNFGPTFIHALYLVNLTADREDLTQNSINGITFDLKFASQMEAGGVVVHLGSHLGKGLDAVFDQLIANMKTILDSTPADSTFLIENSAGQEGKLCSQFVDIQRVLKALPTYVQTKRLGWCFDTCHGFAAGHDLKTVSQEMKKFELLDSLTVIHLNDSRDPYESGRDRHDNIGEGLMGKQTIQAFLHDAAFKHLPLIMEVPGFEGNGPDAKNIEIVKAML